MKLVVVGYSSCSSGVVLIVAVKVGATSITSLIAGIKPSARGGVTTIISSKTGVLYS